MKLKNAKRYHFFKTFSKAVLKVALWTSLRLTPFMQLHSVCVRNKKMLLSGVKVQLRLCRCAVLA